MLYHYHTKTAPLEIQILNTNQFAPSAYNQTVSDDGQYRIQTDTHTFAIQFIVEHLNTLSLRTVWSYIWNLPYRKWIHWDEVGIGPRVITWRPPGVLLSMINHLDRQLEPSQVKLLKCCFFLHKNQWLDYDPWSTVWWCFDIFKERWSMSTRGLLQSMIGHMDRQLEPSHRWAFFSLFENFKLCLTSFLFANTNIKK